MIPAMQHISTSTDRPATLPDRRPTNGNSPVVALIPAYNEERFIGSMVLAARCYVDEVIVVDDGSHDLTAEIARMAGATVVQHPENRGKSAAVNTGFELLRRTRPAAIVMLDGDGQHRVADIPAVLAPVLAGEADIVVGSRFLNVRSQIPLYRQVGQTGLNLATNLSSGVWLTDTQSGYRAFSLQALQTLNFGQHGFSIESEMQFLAQRYGLQVTEVPIQVLYAEPPKRNPVNHGVQVLNAILRLVGQTRPLLFFGVTGVLVMLAGLALGLHVIDIYAASRQFAIGYALIALALGGGGLGLSFTGIVLHSMRGLVLDLERQLVMRLGQER